MNFRQWRERKCKRSKVLLTGQDIISLRQDVSELQLMLSRVIKISLVTLREDVNSAFAATAKAIYKLEALEERLATAEKKIKTLLKQSYGVE